jgi:hypothetical protein
MEHMQPPDAADLVRVTRCYETALVSDGQYPETAVVMLICGLAEGHEGQLHFDPEDRLWWAAVA